MKRKIAATSADFAHTFSLFDKANINPKPFAFSF